MAEVVPLYPQPPKGAVETEPPRDLDPGCTRCTLSKRRLVRHPCMAADGEPGGLLVVGDAPGDVEDNVGRPFAGESGKLLRLLIKRHYPGPVVFDHAVKCTPGKEGATELAVEKCRGYLAAIVRDAKPTKILAMGGKAIESLTGRSMPPLSVRKGYGWLSSLLPNAVPVYFLMNPAAATRNRFIRGWLEEDLKWALSEQVPFQPAWQATTRVVRTVEDVLAADAELTAAPWFSYDVESAGFMYQDFQMLICSMFPRGEMHGWTWDLDSMAKPELRAGLIKLLVNPKARKTGSNTKFDENASILELGVQVKGFSGDTRLQRKVLDPDADADLDTMAELVGMGGHKEEAKAALAMAQKRVVKQSQANVSKQIDLIPPETNGMRIEVVRSIRPGDRTKAFAYGYMPRATLTRYNALDALSTAMLQEAVDQRMAVDDPKLRRTWEVIVKPAAAAVRQIESWGIAVDRNAVQFFHQFLEAQKQRVLTQLLPYANLGFNPDSTNDVGDLLFKKLRLPMAHLTPSGNKPSTDDEALEALKGKHPAVALLQDWRSVSKMDGTYATGMERHIRPDGRIHPSLLLDGARSGRLSCQDPNLQNIPREADSAEGKMARDCFVAPPGYVLLSADYSQLELRIAAMLSGDEAMLEIFAMGGDFHQRTAEFIAPIVWKIKPAEVTKTHRTAAKAFNFGILYGLNDEGIAWRAKCSVAVARQIREAVLGRFHRLDKWIKERLRFSQVNGVAWTWWDGQDARRRPLTKIGDNGNDDKSRAARATNERSSWNTPIQGTGADYCTVSMAAAVAWLLEDAVPAKLVLPIHDALLFEVREDAVDEVAYGANRIMTGWNSNGVPLKVDIDVGTAWGSLKKYDMSRIAA